MLATWQEFKFGLIKRRLNLISSKSAHETQFIYVDDVLKAFKIHDAEGFEAEGEFETDGVTVAYMRDDNGMMYHPKRIPCNPGCVIEVVYETPKSDSTSLASTITFGSLVSLNESVDQLSIKSQLSRDLDPSESLHFALLRKSTMQIQEDMKVATDAMIARNRAGKPLDAHSIVEESFPAEYRKSMDITVTAKSGFERTVIHKLDGLYDQGAVTQQIAREVWELQKQMNDRLILIQNKTEAILTQNYELLEYAIPRLFIVLPETSTSWDPKTMFRTKFRLHFICECGEHTKASGSKIPHHLHLANHEGYVVNKPTEFFEKYGPFLMLMLEMIKVGASVAGVVVPALASLKVVNVLDSAQSTIDSITSKVIEGVDYSLAYLEQCRTLISTSDGVDADGDARALRDDLGSYLAGVEGLEGVDLRQLGSYLAANSSDNLLGNLYRMTTKDGHVKWVCRDHYRAGYQEAHTQKLRDVVQLANGKFDEQLGKIKISLGSRITAAEFYDAISKAKGVLDLDVSFDFHGRHADFVRLQQMITKSNIRSVKMKLCIIFYWDQKLSLSRRNDPIFEIMRLPSVQSVDIINPPADFFLSGPLPRKADFSNLRHLRIGRLQCTSKADGLIAIEELDEFSDASIDKLKSLVARASNLTSLSLGVPSKRLLAVFRSIAEYQTYPIEIWNSGCTLRILPPRSESAPSKTVLRDMAHLFKVHGAQVERLNLSILWDQHDADTYDDSAMEALALATHNGSSLTELSMTHSQYVGDTRIKTIDRIIAQSKLHIKYEYSTAHWGSGYVWSNLKICGHTPTP
ncbi:hypothetical protein BGX26_004863 [Mortierella sp. AD094]|nr:hypothetical protein BGX26_004863 [Mortierella sp. AD094]